MFNIYKVIFNISYSLETYKTKVFSNKKYAEKQCDGNTKIEQYIVCEKKDLENIIENYTNNNKDYIEMQIVFDFRWLFEVFDNVDSDSVKINEVKHDIKKIDFNSHKIRYWIDNLQSSDLIKMIAQEQQSAIDILKEVVS